MSDCPCPRGLHIDVNTDIYTIHVITDSLEHHDLNMDNGLLRTTSNEGRKERTDTRPDSHAASAPAHRSAQLLEPTISHARRPFIPISSAVGRCSAVGIPHCCHVCWYTAYVPRRACNDNRKRWRRREGQERGKGQIFMRSVVIW